MRLVARSPTTVEDLAALETDVPAGLKILPAEPARSAGQTEIRSPEISHSHPSSTHDRG
ncbi:MAG: hypothetical protein K0R62_3111 [Nonomuraea muscovyensis]|jgi:hypothetical protein|nr:hypothetical protein [Nonomuraea muscovyensis]